MKYDSADASELGVEEGIEIAQMPRETNKASPKRKPSWHWFQVPEIASGERSPDDLCGGRRLEGAEFAKRAAELEARDRAERARRATVTDARHSDGGGWTPYNRRPR